MKLTVITPVFNGERYIEETIESVLRACSNLKYEYLVIDDGSTDGTSSILRKFGSQIKVITKTNSGQADSINEGIRLAKGEFAIIVNADDPLESSDLFTQAFQIMEDRSIIVCYPDWKIIADDGKILKYKRTKEYSRKKLIGNFDCLPGPGAVFRLGIAKKIDGWNRSFKFVADYDFWLRMSLYGEFKRIPHNLAAWRSHATSISVSQKNFAMASERLRVIEEFPHKLELDDTLLRRASATSHYQAAVLAYFDPSIPGRKWFLKSLSIDPTIIFRKSPVRSIYLLLHPYSWKLVEMFRLARAK